MATTDNATEYDLPYVDLVFEYLPKKLKSKDKETVYSFAKLGLIQRDRIVEMAMTAASRGLYKSSSTDGKDHTDGSDTKTVTARYDQVGLKKDGNYYTVLRIMVGNIFKKAGPLRIVAYNPSAKKGEDKFKFIYVKKYTAKNRSSILVIPFHGKSKYKNGEYGIELNSFKELARYNG